jgi:predicted AlkP superfamily pyrophosphatase or phosphodiesterase
MARREGSAAVESLLNKVQLAAIACLVALPLAAAPRNPGMQNQAPARKPAPTKGEIAPRSSLIVFISIDQLRYQDLLLLAPEFGPQGFAGLGAPMQLRYDTAITETAADHPTLSTGAWPSLHGIVGNEWLEGGKRRFAVDDASCPLWGGAGSGRSARALRMPTIGDALKIGTAGHGRVVSIANKDRVALFLGGTSADALLFWDDHAGGFTSTTCYSPDAPAWVRALNAAHPLAEFRDYVWTPSRPLELLAKYSDPEAPGVLPQNGIGERFPHPVGQGEVTPRLALALRQTPPATTLAIGAARAAIEALQLGDKAGPQADLLMLGIATIDGVGHQFGAHAPERIDALLRLHDELGAFVSWVRARYGDRVSIVLAADHGVTPIGAELKKLRVETASQDAAEIAAHLETALGERFGKAPAGGFIEFFEPPAMSLRRGSGNFEQQLRFAAETLRKEPAIFRVTETARLFESEAELNAAPAWIRHAVYPGRSSDLILTSRPLSLIKKAADGADHGSPWNDDALVPLLISAPGFSLRSQYRGGTMLATQVAPTLAALLGIAPPSGALEEGVLVRDATDR